MVTISDGKISATVNPFGAELVSLQKDGRELIWCGDESVWGHTSPTLFPLLSRFAGGVYSAGGKTYSPGLHGFARSLPFEARAKSDSAVFVLQSSAQTRKTYPYSFVFEVCFSLHGDTLTVAYTTRNTGVQPLRYMVGGHTAFATEGGDGLNECALRFDRAADYYVHDVDLSRGVLYDRARLLFSGRTLPLHTRLFDNDSLNFCAVPSRSVTLLRRGTPLLRLDYADFAALGVWTVPDNTRFVCIEPWSDAPEQVGAPTAIEQKPNVRMLAPNESETLRYSVTVL